MPSKRIYTQQSRASFLGKVRSGPETSTSVIKREAAHRVCYRRGSLGGDRKIASPANPPPPPPPPPPAHTHTHSHTCARALSCKDPTTFASAISLAAGYYARFSIQGPLAVVCRYSSKNRLETRVLRPHQNAKPRPNFSNTPNHVRISATHQTTSEFQRHTKPRPNFPTLPFCVDASAGTGRS